MTAVESPTTVRFFRGQRRAFDALARRRGITRSVLLRQAVAAVLAAEQDDNVDGVVSIATPHRVKFVLPCVREDDGERARETMSTRNMTTLVGRCPSCGVKGKVESPTFMRRILPSTPQRVIASLSRPTRSGSTITTTTSVSNGSSVSRATTILRFDHRTGCPALGANTRKLSA